MVVLKEPFFRMAEQQRWPFAKFMNWRQYPAVMQREAVTVMTNCSGGGNVVVA
jgi:hypothetical protein